MTRFLNTLTVLMLLAAPALGADVDPRVLEAQKHRTDVLAKARSATIAIFAKGGRGGGSGVVISPDGFALSNFHVTNGSGAGMKVGMADGKIYDAVIVGIDPTGDVALIKMLGRDDFPTAEMADSDDVRVGDWVYAIGNPFLLATDFQPTVTYGIVSGVHRYQYPAGTILEYTDCIQTDASINPGNSGGPLFNDEGQVIGINGRGSFEKRGRVNVGVGYAISINQIKNFLGYLKSGRIVDHATLGATVGTDDDDNVIVRNVLERSDAYRRGVRYGDQITHFGGRPIRTTNGFKNVLGIYPKGWKVPMTFVRDRDFFHVNVRLMGVHAEGELAAKAQGRPPEDHPMPRRPNIPGQPKDGEEDGDEDKPGDDKKDDEKKDDEKAKPAGPKKEPLPKIVQDHYEERSGFMNYYFNRIAQERIWKAVSSGGDYSAAKGAWTLTGDSQAGDAKFILTDDMVEAELPGGRARLPITDDLTTALDPAGSGGLLAALHLWRRFLQEGVNDFGGIYYLGTSPINPGEALHDVLVGVHGGVEARFYFHPETGYLALVETYPHGSTDPCELHLEEYAEAEGRLLPRRIIVRHGDAVYDIFKINEVKLTSPAPEPAS